MNACPSVATWLITSAIGASTILLLLILEDRQSLYIFVAILVTLGLVLPAWKYVAQNAKVLLRGPWEIPTAASMQLDYVIPTTKASTSPGR